MRHAMFTLVLATCAGACVACSPVDATLSELDLDWNRMLEQPKYDAYEKSRFFDDGMVMRKPPEGTARWRYRHPRNPEPPPVTEALLGRGRMHFERFCGACHGVDGAADTMVAQNMTLRPPPSLHTERIRDFEPKRIYDIITRGYGLMPSYRVQLEPRDRWAVAHYVKALQLSRHVEAALLPAEIRHALEEGRAR